MKKILEFTLVFLPKPSQVRHIRKSATL